LSPSTRRSSSRTPRRKRRSLELVAGPQVASEKGNVKENRVQLLELLKAESRKNSLAGRDG
jgi:hypothetical protein